MGLRLQLRKQQAEAGDIVLLYGDESEALTHPYLARAWAKSGADLRVPAPGQAKKVAMLGSLDHATRQLIVHTSPTKRSCDFIAHLEQLDRLFGPQPGRQVKPVVLVEDNGPIHTSKRSLAALAARAHWLTIEWLPKYAPELNEIEPVWRDLKAHHLAHQTFTDIAALDKAVHDAVINLNRERAPGLRIRVKFGLTGLDGEDFGESVDVPAGDFSSQLEGFGSGRLGWPSAGFDRKVWRVAETGRSAQPVEGELAHERHVLRAVALAHTRQILLMLDPHWPCEFPTL